MEAMEEQWLKRNIDCVYFLASPLTCKKGIECEYRHSEIARLNPRDCWYWLAGNCLNPNCAFRHPPFDGPTDNLVDSSNTHHQPAASLKKTNVPCYFFFNGYCHKGERCSFMHGPSDNANWESTKTASAVVDGPCIDRKLAVGSDMGSGAPTVENANPSEICPHKRAQIDIKREVEIHQSTPDNVAERTASQQYSDFLFEEATACRSNSPPPAGEFMQGTSHASTDQISDDHVESRTEQEDWLESSPGFDVLVDDRSEELGYEDDPNGFLREDGEGNGLSAQYMGCRYEVVDSDLRYPDERVFYDHEDYHSCDHSDNENPLVRVEEIPSHMRERGLESHLQKKKFMQARPASGSMDLRNLLKKRRLTSSHNQDCFSRAFKSSQIQGRYRLEGLQQLQGRLASKVVSNGVGFQIENGSFQKSSNHQSRLRHSKVSRSRKHFFKERSQGKLQLKSEVLWKAASRKRQSGEEAMIFTGPKSLSQIREEKRKPKGNINSCERRESSSGNGGEGF